MTPCEIEVLLHYHVSFAQHPRINAPAVQQAVEHFCKAGILVRRPCSPVEFASTYEVTDRGEALVRLLCRTQYPNEAVAWVDQHGNYI